MVPCNKFHITLCMLKLNNEKINKINKIFEKEEDYLNEIANKHKLLIDIEELD